MKIKLKEPYGIAGEAKQGICELIGRSEAQCFLLTLPLRKLEPTFRTGHKAHQIQKLKYAICKF